jgi:hypothetical protein
MNSEMESKIKPIFKIEKGSKYLFNGNQSQNENNKNTVLMNKFL